MGSISKEAWKHPQAAQRELVLRALNRLAETTTHPDPRTAATTFDQVYRWVHELAAGPLQKYREPGSQVERILSEEPPKGLDAAQEQQWGRRKRWQTVRWFVEAWWLDGVIGADPKPEDLSTDDLLTDDGSKATHWYAQNAYRGLVLGAIDLLGTAASRTKRELATRLYNQAYEYVHAVAHPCVLRVPEAKRALSRLWSDHDPRDPPSVTRARRMDSLRYFNLAWYHSAVFGHPRVPLDTGAEEQLKSLIPEAPEWMKAQEEANS